MKSKKTPILNRRVRQFLSKLRVARLATVGLNGYPHVVPIWFRREDDDIVFGSDRDNPRCRIFSQIQKELSSSAVSCLSMMKDT